MNYLMLTPETYWYPRAGTSYSDKNPDWQQTYFSNYRLKVKPLPGLVPISQGEGKCDEEGVFLPQIQRNGQLKNGIGSNCLVVFPEGERTYPEGEKVQVIRI